MKGSKGHKFCTIVLYFLFIVLLFLQNFAAITTETFGLNGLVVFLLITSLLNFKLYYGKFNYKLIITILAIVGFILISSFVNNILAINQILRNLMIVWLIYSTNIFIKKVFNDKNEKTFLNMFLIVTTFFFLYGIYEFIADKYSLPLFLNVFSNNPSYGIRKMDSYYHGWIGKTRLYNVFFEPSVFATFSIYVLFFVNSLQDITRGKKIFLSLLILFNIYFTYSRTGYIIIICMLIIYFIYNKLKWKNAFLEISLLLLPFIILFIMYKIGLNIFSDSSSYIRTYSGIYYLKQSFDSIIHIIFGHASGSVLLADVTDKFVANCAHNGYVDFIYQYGIFAFISLIAFLKKLISNISDSRFQYLFIGIICTCCCFANYFAVETIVVLIVIIYNYCKNHQIGEKNDN